MKGKTGRPGKRKVRLPVVATVGRRSLKSKPASGECRYYFRSTLALPRSHEATLTRRGRASAGNVALNRQDSLARTVSSILNTMQPSLDQLIQICRTQAHDYDFVRVVLASTQGDVHGDVQFTEVLDGPEFRTELHQALRDGLTALGLLGWEFKDGTLRAKGGLFPWHDESLRELFEQVSEEGVDRVQGELGRRSPSEKL